MSASPKDTDSYTQLTNAFFPLAIQMKEAELRITLAIARETFGWHRKSAELSLSDFMRLTGLTRQGVSNGITEGLERKTITRTAKGQGFEYSLNIGEVVNEVDQSAKQTRQRSRLELVNEVDQTSQLNGLEVVNEVDQSYKEEKKEINPKEKLKKAPRARVSKPRAVIPLPDDFYLTEEMEVWAKALCDEYGVDVDLKIETENFKDYCRSKGPIYADYKAGWQTRIRNCVTKLWGTAQKRGVQNGNYRQNSNSNHRESASARNAREYLESAELLAGRR